MKKILSILLICLFIAGQAFGAASETSNVWSRKSGIDSPQWPNIIWKQGVGATMDEAPTVCRIVRKSEMGVGVTGQLSGEVVAWDTVSGDGITVRRPTTTDMDHGNFAGVLVTNICTADNGVVDRSDENWGVICVGGWCVASMDSAATAGQRLMLGTTYAGGLMTIEDSTASKDIGIVILETGSAGAGAHVYIEH